MTYRNFLLAQDPKRLEAPIKRNVRILEGKQPNHLTEEKVISNLNTLVEVYIELTGNLPNF